MSKRKKAGLVDYLKHAFLFRWNLLVFGGAAAAAVLSGHADIALPLVAAGELAYLAGLTSVPKFQKAIDVKVYNEGRTEAAADPEASRRKLGDILGGLDPRRRLRFQKLRQRCLEMQRIADGVRGKAHERGRDDDLRTPALDRLLWAFLRLLFSQQALDRFLEATDEDQIKASIESIEKRQAEARDKGDERIVRSLADALVTAQLRLENYQKSQSNAEFVEIELERIEGKIQALTEMAVSHQDPDIIASQVDSVADSMQHTERAIADLQSITGLSESMDSAPSIMDEDLAEVLETQ